MSKHVSFSKKRLDAESELNLFGEWYLAPWLGPWTAADLGLLIVVYPRLPMAASRESVSFTLPGHLASADIGSPGCYRWASTSSSGSGEENREGACEEGGKIGSVG